MYKFYSLPHHGYLEVPFAEIVQLNIQEKITSFSYLDPVNRLVYLEEDSDATVFLEAHIGSKDLQKIRAFVQENVQTISPSHDYILKGLPHYVHAEKVSDDQRSGPAGAVRSNSLEPTQDTQGSGTKEEVVHGETSGNTSLDADTIPDRRSSPSVSKLPQKKP